MSSAAEHDHAHQLVSGTPQLTRCRLLRISLCCCSFFPKSTRHGTHGAYSSGRQWRLVYHDDRLTVLGVRQWTVGQPCLATFVIKPAIRWTSSDCNSSAKMTLAETWRFTANQCYRWKTYSLRRRRRRRFRIDTEVRCVGAHPHFWPLEPTRVKPN